MRHILGMNVLDIYVSLKVESFFQIISLGKCGNCIVTRVNRVFKLVYNKGITTGTNYNEVLPPTEYKIRQDGFTGKLKAFAIIPAIKILKGPQVLEASSLQEFNRLLDVTNTKYMILPKHYIKEDLNFTNIRGEVV